MNHSRSRTRRAGMTLIEVLLVTALLAFVSLAIFSSVSTMISAKRKIDTQSESTQEFRAVLGLMTRDIQSAFFNTVYDLVWNPVPKVRDPQTGITPPPDPVPAPFSIFYGKENEIFFSARSHQRVAANTPENEQHFVTYQLQEQKLVRAESSRAVNMYDREDPNKFKSTVLIDRVRSLKFRYFDSKQGSWIDNWDSEAAAYRDRLPGAVEINLVIAPLEIEGAPARKEPAKDTVLTTAVTITNVALRQGDNP